MVLSKDVRPGTFLFERNALINFSNMSTMNTMKINSIVNRYIFKEMIPPFLINLGFLSFVFLLAQILEITNMIVNYKTSLISILLLIVYTMPDFLVFTVPMSVMMAILLTFLRMSADNEIIAIKAGGGDVNHLVFPVFLFCFIGFLITFGMSVYGVSWGKNSYKKLAIEIASAGVDAGIKERMFNDSFDGIMFYVNKIDVKNKMLHDIFIHDDRNEKNKSTVIAPRGKRFINSGNQTSVTLRLFDGVINRVNSETNSVNTISFETYDINVPLKKVSGQKKESNVKERDEMSVSELRSYINDKTNDESLRRAASMELNEKIAIPFACFALGMLAMPLGLKSAFSKKSSGLGLGLACFLMYYFLMGFGWSAGKGGLLLPVVGMWLPNILMGSLGFYMYIRVSREKSIGVEFFFDYLKIAGGNLKKIFARNREKQDS